MLSTPNQHQTSPPSLLRPEHLLSVRVGDKVTIAEKDSPLDAKPRDLRRVSITPTPYRENSTFAMHSHSTSSTPASTKLFTTPSSIKSGSSLHSSSHSHTPSPAHGISLSMDTPVNTGSITKKSPHSTSSGVTPSSSNVSHKHHSHGRFVYTPPAPEEQAKFMTIVATMFDDDEDHNPFQSQQTLDFQEKTQDRNEDSPGSFPQWKHHVQPIKDDQQIHAIPLQPTIASSEISGVGRDTIVFESKLTTSSESQNGNHYYKSFNGREQDRPHGHPSQRENRANRRPPKHDILSDEEFNEDDFDTKYYLHLKQRIEQQSSRPNRPQSLHYHDMDIARRSDDIDNDQNTSMDSDNMNIHQSKTPLLSQLLRVAKQQSLKEEHPSSTSHHPMLNNNIENMLQSLMKQRESTINRHDSEPLAMLSMSTPIAKDPEIERQANEILQYENITKNPSQRLQSKVTLLPRPLYEELQKTEYQDHFEFLRSIDKEFHLKVEDPQKMFEKFLLLPTQDVQSLAFRQVSCCAIFEFLS